MKPLTVLPSPAAAGVRSPPPPLPPLPNLNGPLSTFLSSSAFPLALILLSSSYGELEYGKAQDSPRDHSYFNIRRVPAGLNAKLFKLPYSHPPPPAAGCAGPTATSPPPPIFPRVSSLGASLMYSGYEKRLIFLEKTLPEFVNAFLPPSPPETFPNLIAFIALRVMFPDARLFGRLLIVVKLLAEKLCRILDISEFSTAPELAFVPELVRLPPPPPPFVPLQYPLTRSFPVAYAVLPEVREPDGLKLKLL